MTGAREVNLGETAVNMRRRLFWSEQFGVSEIVTFLDHEGDEIEDADEAIVAVVKLAENAWLRVDLSDYHTTPTQ